MTKRHDSINQTSGRLRAIKAIPAYTFFFNLFLRAQSDEFQHCSALLVRPRKRIETRPRTQVVCWHVRARDSRRASGVFATPHLLDSVHDSVFDRLRDQRLRVSAITLGVFVVAFGRGDGVGSSPPRSVDADEPEPTATRDILEQSRGMPVGIQPLDITECVIPQSRPKENRQKSAERKHESTQFTRK